MEYVLQKTYKVAEKTTSVNIRCEGPHYVNSGKPTKAKGELFVLERTASVPSGVGTERTVMKVTR